MKLVDIFIASLWRGGHIIKTLESLLIQKEIKSVHIVLNNYTKEQMDFVKTKLKQKNIFFYKRQNQKGCSERFRNVNKATGKYIAFCDDDLIYPSDYLRYLISGADKYKSLVSLHGIIMDEGKIQNYYKNKTTYRCLKEVQQDIEVDIIGVGVSLVKRSLISGIEKYYNKIKFSNMDDIYYSYLAKENGLKRIVLKHEEGYLRHKKIEMTDNYIFDAYRNNCKPQTDFINRYFK